MKCTVISDANGKILAMGPEPGPVPSVEGEGSPLWHEIQPLDGQTAQIVDVPDDLLNDPERLAKLHETHRLRGGSVEAVSDLGAE